MFPRHRFPKALAIALWVSLETRDVIGQPRLLAPCPVTVECSPNVGSCQNELADYQCIGYDCIFIPTLLHRITLGMIAVFTFPFNYNYNKCSFYIKDISSNML